MNHHEKITVQCWGGCGRSVQIRKDSIRDGEIVRCCDGEGDTRFHPLRPGLLRRFSEHENDDGVIFKKILDVLPDTETIVATWGTPQIWAEKVAKIVIDKAMLMARGDDFIEQVRDFLVSYERVPLWMKRLQQAGMTKD